MKRLWRDYSLSIVLLTLFLVSWGIQTWTGWREFVGEELRMGEVPVVFGPTGYVWSWAQATFENWQSEFLQLLAMAILTSFLIHKGSAESRDGQDEMMERIIAIQHNVEVLRGQMDAQTNEKMKE